MEEGEEIIAGALTHCRPEAKMWVVRETRLSSSRHEGLISVLAEFALAEPFLLTPGFGNRSQRQDRVWKVPIGVGGDRLAVANEGETAGQSVGDQLAIEKPLQGNHQAIRIYSSGLFRRVPPR